MGMIKNERQYRITRAQIQKFEHALEKVKKKPDKRRDVDAVLCRIETDALRSQLGDLRAQLREYEELRSGEVSIRKIQSLEELPQTLVKARIASGLTQKKLAERLGLKEQQIQRYEATDYRTASLARLLEIAGALRIRPWKGLSMPKTEFSLDSFFKRLQATGLEHDFVVKRFAPPQLLASLESKGFKKDDKRASFILRMAEIIGRVFGWTTDSILGRSAPKLNIALAGEVDFKLPSRAEKLRLNAYILYAHYLALLVLESTSVLPQARIPTDYDQVRNAVLSKFKSMSFENVLRYVWSLGIPVLPLNDPGAFHGACWRVDGRNIIVLKQRTRSQARWLFDLLHELRHVAEDPDQPHLSLIESSPTSEERRKSAEEEAASQFAGDVILAGRAEELAQLCVTEAKGRVEWLKRAVPEVASREKVAADALANCMAFRLSLQGINWWGTAENLQLTDSEPWAIARDLLLRHCALEKLNEVDRNLLILALADEEG
jgi:transcriptional regulator with XRE-family HTH domain